MNKQKEPDPFRTSSPREVNKIMNEFCLHPKKKWGQNFLIDGNIVRKILNELDAGSSDHVVEIGAGLGALTLPVAGVCKKLLAIDVDPGMVKYLSNVLDHRPEVTIVQGDARKVSLSDFCFQAWGEVPPLKITANLPYYITSTFIFDLFRDELLPWTRAVLMVQKEAADRITASVNSAAYGSLSVLCRAFTQSRTAFSVSSNVFYPRPKVDSAVVVMEPRETDMDHKEKKELIRTVTSLFQYRRKTLYNSLTFCIQDKRAAGEILKKALIDGDRRPESLDPEEFATISRLIYN